MIKCLTIGSLVEFFEGAVKDNYYQPHDYKHDTGGYTLDELREELLRRLSYTENQTNSDNYFQSRYFTDKS